MYANGNVSVQEAVSRVTEVLSLRRRRNTEIGAHLGKLYMEVPKVYLWKKKAK